MKNLADMFASLPRESDDRNQDVDTEISSQGEKSGNLEIMFASLPREGFASNVGALLKSGAKGAFVGMRIAPDVAAGRFDENSAELISEELNRVRPRPKELAAAQDELMRFGEEWDQADGALESAGVLGRMLWSIGKEAVTNPKGLAYFSAEQAANMAPGIAGMLTGAKVGALGGPVAPVTIPAGAITGAFAGQWPIEAGMEFVGYLGEALHERGLKPTPQNVQALLADQELMGRLVSQARKKATVTSGVDAALTVAGGRIASAPARAAQKAAVEKLGAGATREAIEAETRALLSATPKAKRVGMGLAGAATDVVGEGISDGAGAAAAGHFDMGEVALEMFGGLGGAAVEVPAAVRALREKPVGRRAEDDAAPVPSSVAPAPAAEGVDEAAAPVQSMAPGPVPAPVAATGKKPVGMAPAGPLSRAVEKAPVAQVETVGVTQPQDVVSGRPESIKTGGYLAPDKSTWDFTELASDPGELFNDLPGAQEPEPVAAPAPPMPKLPVIPRDTWRDEVEAPPVAAPVPNAEAQASARLRGMAPVVATPLDARAHEAAASPVNERPEPSPAQIEAGNYKKGHVRLHGLDISIENPAGSVRKGVDETGRAWETELSQHYGYIRGTVGPDKDHIDVFIKPGVDQATAGDAVFVVDQKNVKTGRFDEPKVMMGYASADEARSAYLSNYDESGPRRIMAVTPATVAQFRGWLDSGHTKKPFSVAVRAEPVADQVQSVPAPKLNFFALQKQARGLGLKISGKQADGSYFVTRFESGAKVFRGSLAQVGDHLAGAGKVVSPGPVAEKAESSIDDLNSGKAFVDSIHAKIDKWIDIGTNRLSRPMDKNWERGALKRFVDQELNARFAGKQVGRWAAAKIAVGKAQSFEELKAAVAKVLDPLQRVSEEVAGQEVKAPAANTVFTEDAYQKARALLRSKLNNLNSGIDPELMQAGFVVAGYHIERGARKFVDFSARMIEDMGEAVKPYLKAFYNGVRDLPGIDQITKEMDDYATVTAADASAPTKEVQKKTTQQLIDEALSGATPLTEADRLRRRADALMKEAAKIFEGIEPGQPVLSTRDRNRREKAAEKAREAGELYERAADAEKLAESATLSKKETGDGIDQRGGVDLERNRADAETQDGVGTQGVSDGAGADGAAGERGVSGPAGRGGASRGGKRLSGREAAAAGEHGDFSPYRDNEQSVSEGGVAGGDFGGRSGDAGLGGLSPDRIPTETVGAAASGGVKLIPKRRAQQEAQAVKIIPGDQANIDQSLPFLHDGQRADVLFAEKRFSLPTGYGVLFTNGTGTGKTYSGLGIVKRFERQGKINILILVPDAKAISDWKSSGKNLDLEISELANTTDGGSGVVVTTYANAGQNDALARRDWDLIVADESHNLMQSKDGKATAALEAVRAISKHPRGRHNRHAMLHRKEIAELEALAASFESKRRLRNLDDTRVEGREEKDRELAGIEKRMAALRQRLEAARNEVFADVDASQGEGRARVVFLSATPFAYEKTVDYAEGYLFDYPEDGRIGNSRQGGFERFMVDHFGYRIRYHKLTEPGPEVNRGLMQRQFNSWLKKEGVLSGRMLDVDKDYDRKFVLTQNAVGAKIDEGLQFLWEHKRFFPLWEKVNERFDHLSRRYLLEAIKAREVVPLVREHLDHGRKVVVFHDYKKGGGFNPFDLGMFRDSGAEISVDGVGVADGVKEETTLGALVREFEAQRPDLVNLDLTKLVSPIVSFQRHFPEVLIVNGDRSNKENLAAYERFNDDASGPQVILVQSAKNAGWSGHDTTGKYPRVLFNLGLPTRPTMAIQQEGRIYRVGQASNAMFRYLNTGTNWERFAFATTIAHRSSAAENLALGEEARALMDAFIQAFEESDAYSAGHEGEGTGGKERDRAANAALSEWDRATTLYFAQHKRTSQTKAVEGKDYFATPEPLGLKMVEWAGVREGDTVLEPSAGHGAIARWFPDNVARTVVEPSAELASRLKMVTDAKLLQENFEDLHVVNKFDAIVMNPPFGVGGKTAIEHLDKATTHLRDGGRVVALIPTGPAADKRFEGWFYEESDKGKALRPDLHLVADVRLPGVTFERAGTKVATRIVVIDKLAPGQDPAYQVSRDYSDAQDIKAFFERIENASVPERVARVQAAEQPVESQGPAQRRLEKVAAREQGMQAAEEAGLEVVEHVTRKGKRLRGVVRRDLSEQQAQAIDPYTFKKDGGFFIRLENLSSEADAASPDVPKFARQAAPEGQSFVTAVPVDLFSGENVWRQANEFYREHLQGRKVANRFVGEVEFTGKGRTKALSVGRVEPRRMSVVRGLSSLVERGILVGEEVDRKGRESIGGYLTLVAPVKIGENVYAVKLTIRQDVENGKKFYTFAGYEVEPNAINRGFDGESVRPQGSSGSYDVSIAQLVEAVNGRPVFAASADSVVAGPLPDVEFDAVLERITSRIEDAGARQRGFVPVPTARDLPPEILAEIEKQGNQPEDIDGVFHRGKVYLVRDHIASAQRLEQILFHEWYGHAGLYGMFGNDGAKLKREMVRLYDLVTAKRLFPLGREHGINLMAYGHALAQAKYDLDTRKAIMMEEMLAFLAQKYGRGTIARRVRELIGQIRALLRKSGFVELAQWGESDIAFLLKQARAHAELGAWAADVPFVLDGQEIVQKLRERGITDEMLEKFLAGAGPRFAAAWHGTPHDFDRFTTEKIGTGEGAQAYGYGLYFASSKEVAEWYRDKLTSFVARISVSGKSIGKFNGGDYKLDGKIAKLLEKKDRSRQQDIESVVSQFRKSGFDWDKTREGLDELTGYFKERALSVFDEVKSAVSASVDNKGRLYHVELAPKDDEWLLWDKPLSEQSEKVRAALGKSGMSTLQGEGFQWKRNPSGETIYRMIAASKLAEEMGVPEEYREVFEFGQRGGAEAASKYLHSLGIRGIKYLDGSSRGKGDGAYNYVIFNENDVEIVSKFALRDKAAALARLGKELRPDKNGLPFKVLGDFLPERVKAAVGMVLSNPHYGAKVSKVRGQAYDLALERGANANEIKYEVMATQGEYEGLEGVRRHYRKATRAERAMIDKLLVEGDIRGEEYAEAQLWSRENPLGEAVPQVVGEAYLAFRRTLSRATEVMFDRLGRLRLLPYEETPYHDELIGLLDEGLSLDEVARRFGINEKAVDAYQQIRAGRKKLDEVTKPYRDLAWYGTLRDVLVRGLTAVQMQNEFSKSPELLDAWRAIQKEGSLRIVTAERFKAAKWYPTLVDLLTVGDDHPMLQKLELYNAYRGVKEYDSQLAKLKNEWGKVKGYLPRIRKDGEQHVKVFALNDDGTYREVWMQPAKTKFGAKVLAAKVRDNLKDYIPHSFEQDVHYEVVVEPNTATPEEIFQGIGSHRAIEALLSKVFDRATDAGIIENPLEVQREVLRILADEISARGFGRHRLSRAEHLIEGYEMQNTPAILSQFVGGMAGWLSKSEFAMRANRLMSKIPATAPHDKSWVKDYVDDALKNSTYVDQWFGTARSFAALMYLGFRMSSAALNATQNYVWGQAKLSSYTKGATRKLMKAQRDVIGDYLLTKAGRESALTTEEQWVLEEGLRRGRSHANYVRAMSGLDDNGGVLGKGQAGIRWLTEKAMIPFQMVETHFNREPALLAAFRVFRHEKGMSKEAALKEAERFVDDVHFVVSKENIPALLRKMGPVGRTLYTFQSYTHNYLLGLFSSLTRGEFGVVMRSMTALVLLGGIMALPFGGDLDKWYRRMFGERPLRLLERWLRETAGQYTDFGDQLADFVMHGAPALAGVNFSNALGVNVAWFSPEDESLAERFTGVWAGMAQKVVYAGDALGKGDAWRAVEFMTPEALASVMRAYRLWADGTTTLSGRPVFGSDGKQVRYTPKESFIRAFGFMPLEPSKQTRNRWDARMARTYWTERKADVLAQFRAAKDRQQAMRLVRDFNLELRAAPGGVLVPPITIQTLRQALTAKPDKREMLYLR